MPTRTIPEESPRKPSLSKTIADPLIQHEFSVVHVSSSSWMAVGHLSTQKAEEGEVWVDGCCVQQKSLAERIAANMQAAYRQGIQDASRTMIRLLLDVTERNERSISDLSTFNGFIVNSNT